MLYQAVRAGMFEAAVKQRTRSFNRLNNLQKRNIFLWPNPNPNPTFMILKKIIFFLFLFSNPFLTSIPSPILPPCNQQSNYFLLTFNSSKTKFPQHTIINLYIFPFKTKFPQHTIINLYIFPFKTKPPQHTIINLYIFPFKTKPPQHIIITLSIFLTFSLNFTFTYPKLPVYPPENFLPSRIIHNITYLFSLLPSNMYTSFIFNQTQPHINSLFYLKTYIISSIFN